MHLPLVLHAASACERYRSRYTSIFPRTTTSTETPCTTGMTNVFIDTNLLIYALSDDQPKRAAVNSVLYGEHDWIISTQVVIEFINVCQRKHLLPPDDLATTVEEIVASADRLITVDMPVIRRALALFEAHSLSWWDSLIVAAAQHATCSILYTEDLQHGHTFDDALRIENPFQSG